MMPAFKKNVYWKRCIAMKKIHSITIFEKLSKLIDLFLSIFMYMMIFGIAFFGYFKILFYYCIPKYFVQLINIC